MKKGFTLLELIVVIVIAALLGSIAIVTFDNIKYKQKVEITKVEAKAHGKEALAFAVFENRNYIEDTDFRETDLNKYLDSTQLASSVKGTDSLGNYWLYTSVHNLTAKIYSNGDVVMDLSNPSVTPSPTPTPTPSPSPSIISTVSITSITCTSSTVATCDENTSSKAMVLNWSSSNQGSYKVEFTPDLPVRPAQSPIISNNIFDTELYLGMGTKNIAYTITLSIYPESNQNGTPATDTIIFTPSATTTVSDGGSTSGTGTFTDASNNTTIERSLNETNLSVNSANWQYIEVAYNGTTRRVYKSNGVSTDNPLFKISNTKVNLQLPSTTPITITVKYNGNSSGNIYILQ
jgi:prepilin-type N-terminal cleavage/methylation domain-containing protein